MFFPILYVL
ncbi:pilVB' C-terminal segment domain protein, partial [Escherichia coli CB7326]